MTGEIKVSSEEVKRYFLLADAGKKLFNPERDSTLEDSYRRIFDEIFGLDKEELNVAITDKVRLDRYSNFSWYRNIVPLLEIGPYSGMGGLDTRLTLGNILDVQYMN